MRRSLFVVLALVMAGWLGWAQQYGGTVVIAWGTDAVRLDPADMTDNPSETVLRHIMDGLVEFDEQLNKNPCLAKSWEISEDGTVYTFHLREGIKFHDGTPFNAEAVAFNFNRIITQNLRRTALFQPYIDSVTAVDEYTVVFKLKAPFGAFLNHLAHGAALIQSPTAIQTWGAEVGKHPVGTGPFKFVEWVPGDHITLEANPDYWRGRPYLDRIIFQVVPEASTRVFRLESGEAHIATRIPPTEVPRLKANPNIEVLVRQTLRVIYIGMNNQKPPFNDVRVRQAVNYAIDKELLCQSILGGYADPADSPLAPLTWGYYSTGGYPYDPEKAKALLAEAGYPNGFEATLYTPKGRYLMDYETALAVQAMLAEVGIRVRVQVMEWAAYLSMLERREQEMFLLGWAPSTADGDWVLRPLFHSANWSPRDNNALYANPEVDALIEQGMRAMGEARYELYKKAQEIIVRDAPWAFLYVLKDINAHSKKLHNVQYLPIEIILVKNAWLG
jgi:ABC-type transport system substrate-binding protein